jgi:hypothetical protein
LFSGLLVASDTSLYSSFSRQFHVRAHKLYKVRQRNG